MKPYKPWRCVVLKPLFFYDYAGVRKSKFRVTTSAFTGAFQYNPKTREEYFT
jgi:GTP cyclohydrolase I